MPKRKIRYKSCFSYHSDGLGLHHFSRRQDGQISHVDHDVTDSSQRNSNHDGSRKVPVVENQYPMSIFRLQTVYNNCILTQKDF